MFIQFIHFQSCIACQKFFRTSSILFEGSTDVNRLRRPNTDELGFTVQSWLVQRTTHLLQSVPENRTRVQRVCDDHAHIVSEYSVRALDTCRVEGRDINNMNDGR